MVLGGTRLNWEDNIKISYIEITANIRAKDLPSLSEK
jgi:hypothetical protein